MTRTFSAGVSTHPVLAEAVGELAGQVLDEVGPEPDLAVLFASGSLAGALDDVVGAVRTLLRPGVLLGATASAVLGGSVEVEDEPALALWAGRTGPVAPVRLVAEAATAPGSEPGELRVTGLPAVDDGTLVLLADPYSFPADTVLDALAERGSRVRAIGGLASGGGPGGNRLVLDGDVHHEGAVGVHLPAGRLVVPVVSQGCRPVGDPMVVTRAERNLLYELAGQPALQRLLQTAEQVSSEDRALMARGVHLGVVVDEQRAEFGPGDFLIRNVLGGDKENGVLAVGAVVPVGTTVQFQVRDPDTADEDLDVLLARAGGGDGALVFTCNGRGRAFFGEPGHDAAAVAGVVSHAAVAGMFCAGEIGPVGARSYVHGLTASVALFPPA